MYEEDSIENLQRIYDDLRRKEIEGITIRFADGEEESTDDTHINDMVCDAFRRVIEDYKQREI